jgi:V/A-type H+/Na+-transporting ATPase subunit D
MNGRERLAPTRMNLLRARRELSRVVKGITLTRRKREALVSELFAAARPAVGVRQRIAESATRAGLALTHALGAHGVSGLTPMSWPLKQPSIDLRPAQVWGIAVSEVVGKPTFARTMDARGLAPQMVGPSTADASVAFESLTELLVEAAPREQRVRRLSEALADTTRRLRTLEQRVAPALTSAIAGVRRQLEEREREEQIRLRHVQRRRGR